MWVIARAYKLFSAVLPECRLLRSSVDIKGSYLNGVCCASVDYPLFRKALLLVYCIADNVSTVLKY